MVKTETKSMIARTASKSSRKKTREKEYETNVLDYGESQIEGTDVVVSVAVATFVLKDEDKHQVLRVGDDSKFRNCQIKLDCEPQLSAFMGVYDGHDGDFASEYCRQGLLPHIIAELRSTTQQSSKGWGFAVDRANAPLKLEEGVGKEDSTSKLDMEVPYTAAFQKAEERFGNELEPPTFDEVSKTQVTPLKVAPPGSYNPMQWISSATAAAEPRRGGTTACTMSLFTEEGTGSSRRLIPSVVVANTGDSRLVTDDASGTDEFRQVTTDHRPDDPAEKRRLTACVARSDCTLHRSTENHDTRIHPGGLAVSRTIGDLAASKAVICAPQVINVPLNISTKKGKEKTQRFVLGTDGLWDSLSNEAVGKAASRQTSKAVKAAAEKVLQKCLDKGGSRDDVTICVVDISCLIIE